MPSKKTPVAFGIILLTAVACGPEDPTSAKDEVTINEVMPANTSIIADDMDEYDDWIELYNSGDTKVDLEGYYISDDENDLYKKRLDKGLEIASRGTLILWADKDTDQGPNHLPFKLKAAGEQVFLSNPDGEKIDGLTFENGVADQAFGRFPDAKGDFILCDKPSPNSKNGTICE